MFTLTIEDSNSQIADQFSFDHGSYVIGRLDECDIVLPSSSVSRKHARIFIENDRCYIEDLGSANGVVVDGQRVIQRRDLGTASQIRIGDFYMYLEFKGAGQHGRQSVLNTLFIANNSDHHKLVRVNDAFAGEEFSLSEIENTIGRTDDNFILLSDQSISRQHAKIVREADSYSVVDLGSSNGTRLNGKPLKSPKRLTPGDLVEFGDVEFVFTEGDVQVNVSDYARKKRSSKRITFVGGLVVLVLFGLALGGLIVYGLFWFKKNKAPQPQAAAASATAPQSVEARAASMLSEGKSHMHRREWSKAIASFDEVLALAPDNKEAESLREQARTEMKAAELLRKGEDLSGQGRHSDARKVLEQIPKGTVAYEQSVPTLAHVEKTLAYNLKNEAIRLLKHHHPSSSQLQEAHDKLVRALKFSPDDTEALKLVDDVEAKMKRKHLQFKKYARQ